MLFAKIDKTNILNYRIIKLSKKQQIFTKPEAHEFMNLFISFFTIFFKFNNILLYTYS